MIRFAYAHVCVGQNEHVLYFDFVTVTEKPKMVMVTFCLGITALKLGDLVCKKLQKKK